MRTFLQAALAAVLEPFLDHLIADDAVGAIPDAKAGVAGLGGLWEGDDVNIISERPETGKPLHVSLKKQNEDLTQIQKCDIVHSD